MRVAASIILLPDRSRRKGVAAAVEEGMMDALRMRQFVMNRFLFSVTAALLLAGCGGGSSNGSPTPATYTVGGTISLLSGSGLVLRNNGGDDLPISNNGPFTFVTRLATSTSYSITVFTQPTNPSQTCVVTNGAGGWGSSIPVTVTCTTDTHTVGGTVTGLTGSGLVVQDNGGDDQNISVAGAFTFAKVVASGGDYNVTVLTEPSAPAQTCTVTNGSGVVAAADITNITVTCGAALTGVSVAPANVNVAAGASQQFTATVTGMPSTAVTWQVNGIAGGNSTVGTVSGTGQYVAPNAATTTTVTAVLQGDPSKSASGSINVLAPHRIAVRTGADSLAEFYNRVSGSAFVVRGNNYIRLATLTKFDGTTVVAHSTFIVGLYDAVRTESALALMQARGFNTVRVFLEGCCVGSIGDPAGVLLDGYLNNVVDFLQRAKQHGIVVMITDDWLPDRGDFGPGCARYDQFELFNLLSLCAGGVLQTRQFFSAFVQGLVARKAPLEAILGFELRNEYFYDQNYLPFTLTSGLVTTANGSSYDMADPVARQRMMDEGLIYFTDTVASGIHELDPTALVTVGFFWPQSPNPTRLGDSRLVSVYPAMATTTADYVDIHAYPTDISIDQMMQNFGMTGYQQAKPVLMGEYGVTQGAYPLIIDAAAVLEAWQIGSCPYHLRGWLLWTWDTDSPPYPAFWTDQNGDGSIDRALAPASRPDPCAP